MKKFQNPRSAAAPNYGSRSAGKHATTHNSAAPRLKTRIVRIGSRPLLETAAND
jgi:hypothetical protein